MDAKQKGPHELCDHGGCAEADDQPNTGERQDPDLVSAHQMIDLISLLQDKTKGNLTADEAKLVDDLLYELRMRFVQAQQGERRIIEP